MSDDLSNDMYSYRQCHLLYAQSNMLSRKCGMSPAPHED